MAAGSSPARIRVMRVRRAEQALAASSSNLAPYSLLQRRGDLDADADRPERDPVGHDHEHALALLARVLAGRWREADRIEADPGGAGGR